MSEKNSSIESKNNQPVLRILFSFLIGFFLIMTLLTAFIAVPQINKSLEFQRAIDKKITLEIETELFKRFVENHRTILRDLAKFPVITSAALLSKSDNPDFVDLVDNFSIAGEKSRLILQNISGDIIYQTTQDIKGDFSPDAKWAQKIINDEAPYNFQLLEQENENFGFVISIPLTYLGSTEGILSAEITAPLLSIFSAHTIKEGGAFKLKQNGVVVKSSTKNITLPREVSTTVTTQNIELTYISDDTQVLQAKSKLRNTILGILFIGLAVSFILFTLLGYRTLANNEDGALLHHRPIGNAFMMPILIGLIGIATSISGYLVLKNFHEQQVKQEILTKNRAQIVSVERRLEANLEVLNSLKSFFYASENVDRKEFKTFVHPLLKNHKSIQALEWVPKIKHHERDTYQRQARSEGFPKFQITEQNEKGEMILAKERDAYFPVYYIEPMEGNEKSLGLDLASSPENLKALNRARDTGRSIATALITPAQGKEQQARVLIFTPIYSQQYFDVESRKGIENKNAHLQGFILAVMHVEDIVKSALDNYFKNTEIFIEDITNIDNPDIIFSTFNRDSIQPDLLSTGTIDVAGRTWKIQISPSSKTIKNSPLRMSWAVLLGGLVFTLFITYTFIQLIRRHQIIESIVESRTEEIKEAKQFQGLVMSNIPDLLFVKDEKFRIVEANTAFLNLYPEEMRDAVIGTTSIEKYSPEEAEAFLHFDKLALKNGSSETEETIQFPDGRTRTMFTKKVRFENNRNEKFILAVAHDITAMKKAEEEILHSNIELERFAYVASHDLQEPLRMVTNFTELLQKRYGEKLDDTAKEYIDFAANGARRMQDLVNDLLEYARIGQEAESFKATDLNQTMKTIKENLKDSIDSTHAIVSYDTLPVVHTNPIRIMRVIQNLIGNSIKYQKENAQPKIIVSTAEQSGFWEISIKDNGIGMKQEYCEKIFEPFKRLHAKNEYSGTGMGLSICRKLIEGFGGKIWAHSTLGEGTVFTFTMPMYNQKQETEKDKADD